MIPASCTDLVNRGYERLVAAGVENAGQDCARLLRFVLDGDDMSHPGPIRPDDGVAERFLAAVDLRCDRMPVAQITGWQEFYGLEFKVTRDVLVPRPESEALVEMAMGLEFRSVLDIGTGSGCLLLTLLSLNPAAEGTGVDICNSALKIASENADALGLGCRCRFQQSDWLSSGMLDSYDLIISNPPYTTASEYTGLSRDIREYEPRQALTLGGNGTEAYEAISRQAMSHMQPDGWLLLEIGYGQFREVRDILESSGYCTRMIGRDLDDRIRAIGTQAAAG